jgi:ketosteroid isomerase-like protein
VRSNARHLFRFVVAVMVLIGAANPSYSQDQTVYEPSANDPRIVAVLDTQKRAQAAAGRADWNAVEQSFAPDVVVHSPINRVVNLENIMGRFRAAQIGAEPGAERRLEFVGVRGDSVVVMGEEIYTPGKNAPNAGKLVHRRFTDIWKEYGGRWKLAIRQATVTSAQ